MNEQAIIIPYDVSLKLINQRMKKIFHDYSEWGNEMVIILEGEGTYHYNDIEFKISKGDVFVLRDNYVKEITNATKLTMCSIFYKDDTIHRLVGSFRRLDGYQRLFIQNPLAKKYDYSSILHADDDLLEELYNHISRMNLEYKLQEVGFEQVLNSSFFIIITLVSRAYGEKEDYSILDRTSNFARAVAYMQGNFSESPRIGDVAAIANLSERQFVRKFVEQYGEPPSKYLLKLKLGRACVLLEETQMTISEIAMDVGFGDSNYFAAKFKKYYEITPTKYRQEHIQTLEMSESKRYSLKDANR